MICDHAKTCGDCWTTQAMDRVRERAEKAEARVAELEAALGQIAECADWCEECEPTERKLATHTVQPYGVPEFLCDECAEMARQSYRRAKSKGCGPQPEVEPHEQEAETTIALKALGLWPTGRTAPSVGEVKEKR